MKSCFGYVRVSTVKQGEGVSLEAQREAIERFAGQNSIEIIQWFEEKETAAKSGRPVFNGMIKQLRSGKADGLVIHKIDRSARNFADWAKIGDLSDSGIDVYFASESLDFRSRGGRLSADIQAVIAADYIRNLREETIKGINGRLKQGLYPFRAPIGYLDNGGGKPKSPDPVRAPLIKQAFELYASGQHSLRTLRQELGHIGLRNAQDNPLSKCGVETVLNNPFYCGLIRIKRTGNTYKGAHEPIISANLFEQVQEIKSGKSGKKVTKHNHTYRGLFRCADCNSPMTPERQKSHVYYRCQLPECSTKTVREEVLEQAIVDTLSIVKLTDDDVADLTEQIEAWIKARAATKEDNTIAMQLTQLQDRLERLTDALIDHLIDKETFNTRKQKLLISQRQLEEKQAETEKMKPNPHHIRKFLELVKSLATTYIFAKPAERREIAEITTSNRRVSGKNVYLEPANWLVVVDEAIAGLVGAPYRPTSRRVPDIAELNIEEFVALLSGDETAVIENKIEEMTGRKLNN